MENSNIIELVRKEVETLFEGEHASHDFEHVMRVYNLCMHIGKIENANLFILKLSALLHDVGRKEESKSGMNLDHVTAGIPIARAILEKHFIEEQIILDVLSCISTHNFKSKNPPVSLEAKVLYDADKLDSIGAVGIGRSFMFAQQLGAKLHNHKVDIEKTKEYSKDDTAYREYILKRRFVKDKLFTNEGKRIAKERHDFMVLFFERLNKEVDGDL